MQKNLGAEYRQKRESSLYSTEKGCECMPVAFVHFLSLGVTANESSDI